MAIARIRQGNYPAILSYGFRPFFLAGSIYAGLTILFWLPLFYGYLETKSLFSPVDWHVHEMLFGYVAAVITGFLLTAIPNWTGRLPVQGTPLLLLVVLWAAGRTAVFFSAELGLIISMVIDCAFLVAVASAAATEIIAGRNWRNLKVLAPVMVLLAANVGFHIEVHLGGQADVSRRMAIAAAIALIMIVGGRIIPSFTRNWLVRENPGRLPAPFDRFDVVVIVLSALALAAWTIAPEWLWTAVALLAAAAVNLARLVRWAGDRALRDPLVLILHIGYAFVPAGLLLAGLGVIAPTIVPPAAGIHAFGAGAIGCMTLAVMTRATLGHTGRALRAGPGACAIYVAVISAAIARICAVLSPDSVHLLYVSALLWAAAYIGYALVFGAMLARPKLRTSQLR